MKLPRNLSGTDLSKTLKKFGYVVIRQTGSHIRLSSSYKAIQHHITIPAHNPLKVGLSQILSDVAAYIEIDRDQLITELFT